MEKMSSRAWELLEYNKIIDLLAEQAGSELAKAGIRELAPMTNERMVKDALTETTEAVSVIVYKGAIPIGDPGDISGILSMAAKGRCLSMRELLCVRRSLAAAREVKSFLSSDVPELHEIAEIADLIETLTALEQDIERCILSEDEMADSASSTLRGIRRDIRNKNDSIKNRLNRFTSQSSMQKYLQDAIVTMRNGRFVIPVKREYASLVPGLVHDQSATGATLFIEPQAIVTMNNELRELGLAEEAEIARILQSLSDRVSEHRHAIANNQELLTKLDIINAKGKLATIMKAEEPNINTCGILDIRQGRHPLIPDDKVVPIDVRLGEDFKTLLITGPNTGGKTVTLKTIGLFILMAETGLHLPCSCTSRIPLIKDVYADIGDEQSIEQSLSTFSAHMTNIVSIFRTVDRDSLVLLDELGAGTDPTEGAALGIAELETLRERGALVAATTHYTELKKYALATPEVENASMEFDVETLSPTYRLRVGLPGKSNAFEISRKLGLSEDIIDRAEELLSGDEMSFEDAVTRVEEDRKKSETELEEARVMRAEAEAMLAAAREKLARTEKKREALLEEARSEARDMLRLAQDEVTEIRNELKAMEGADRGKLVEKVASSRRRLREAEGAFESKRADDRASAGRKAVRPEDVEIGTRVKLLTIDQNGVVETLPDSRGKLKVKVGALKLDANLRDLMIIESEPEGNKEKQRRKYSGSGAAGTIGQNKARNIRPSINVIGKNLDDALMDVEKYIDDAFIAGLHQVTVVHGRGKGILKDGIRRALRSNRYVKSFKGAPYNEGGEGATIVEIKEK